ncbi:SulP family inorganic anion transporter [Priestia endophytica]|jgi:SulP family sulfate permease|uniref:SulP family inorganic anion transporter n=1 Tax=Priestia endophytica TaxID=135735 RepID=UPI00124CF9A7|nr:SulP family inorganic anion transporter [Priestia endophytica]KAB2490337.1 sulfate transporter [Priestia endophytica]
MNTPKKQPYTLEMLRRDLIAGIIVGIVAIPLGMGFAIASGTEPVHGIYTVVIAGIIVSTLGGSKFQIAGPTGAFVPILLGIVTQYGFDNLMIATFMAGLILIVLGLCKAGSLVKYIPKPVIIGFTAGIAIIIFYGQLPHFLGLYDTNDEAGFLAGMVSIIKSLPDANFYGVLTGIVGLASIILATRFVPKIPGALIGVLVSTAFALLLFPDKLVTINTLYGAIPNTLPQFGLPEITLEKIITLIPAALAIAFLGGLESLLSAVVADEMAGTKHKSNREIVAQGIANTILPFFQGIPATGAIARTATNIRNKAATRFSGVVHALFALMVLLVLAPYASHIPLASLAPVLMVVAWNMSERKHFAGIVKEKSRESFVLLITFFFTVFFDLMVGIGVGMLTYFVLNFNKTAIGKKVRSTAGM